MKCMLRTLASAGRQVMARLHLTIWKQVDVVQALMPFYDRLSGAKLDFSSPYDTWRHRLARMRHNVWLGVDMLRYAQQQAGGTICMYTLTYARTGEWKPRHISNMVRWLRAPVS